MFDYAPIVTTLAVGVVGLFQKGGIATPLAKIMLVLILVSAALSIYGKHGDAEKKQQLELFARSTGVDPSKRFQTANLIIGVPETGDDADKWYDYAGVGPDLLFGEGQTGALLGTLELEFDWTLSYSFEFHPADAAAAEQEPPLFKIRDRDNAPDTLLSVFWGNCETSANTRPEDCSSETPNSNWWSDPWLGATAHGVALDRERPAAFWLSVLAQRESFGRFSVFANTPELKEYYLKTLQMELKFYPLEGEGAFEGCVPVLLQRIRASLESEDAGKLIFDLQKAGQERFVPCEDQRGVG